MKLINLVIARRSRSNLRPLNIQYRWQISKLRRLLRHFVARNDGLNIVLLLVSLGLLIDLTQNRALAREDDCAISKQWNLFETLPQGD